MRQMFPETRYSAVARAASTDPEERAKSLAALAAVYYRPVYAHLRHKWRFDPERAEDVAQSFFAAVVERSVFAAYAQERGRFRTFVRTCLDHLVESELRAQNRIKRGGGKRFVPIDAENLEGELAITSPTDSPEQAFDREFVRSLFAAAVADLKSRLEGAGKAHYYALFERYDLSGTPDNRPTYAALAKETGLAVTDVTNYLFFARKEFRRAVVARLREITNDEDELREEAAEMGIDIDAVK